MIRATCWSWLPRLVAGNGVEMVAEVPASSALRPMASLRTLLAALMSALPPSISINCWMPSFRASAAACGQSDRPLASRLNPGNRLAVCTTLPVQKSDGPAIDTAPGNEEPAFNPLIRSRARAAQPVPPDPGPRLLCICWIWSECEKRFVGTSACLARNAARLTGSTSIPVFASTASRPWAQSGWMASRPGLKA